MNKDNEDIKKIYKKMKREEMQKILDKARKEFKIEKAKKEKELASILPSVLKRVDKEEEMQLKNRKSKTKKSKKRHKSSSPHSDSGEEKWVDVKIQTNSLPSTLTRDSWMTMDFLENLPTVTKLKKEYKRPDPHDKLGCHERELNPYWKNGGHGLPAEQDLSKKLSEEKSKIKNIGDGGLRWWEKALERCKQMAIDEKKSLEEVASERYESLDFIYKKIADCGGSKSKNLLDFSKNSFKNFHKPSSDFSTSKSQEFFDVDKRSDGCITNNLKNKNWKKHFEETSHLNKNNSTTINKDTLEIVSSASESDEEVTISTKVSSNCLTNVGRNNESQNLEITDIKLTDEQMNQLGAQIVKAEILGDYAKAEQIKKKKVPTATLR